MCAKSWAQALPCVMFDERFEWDGDALRWHWGVLESSLGKDFPKRSLLEVWNTLLQFLWILELGIMLEDIWWIRIDILWRFAKNLKSPKMGCFSPGLFTSIRSKYNLKWRYTFENCRRWLDVVFRVYCCWNNGFWWVIGWQILSNIGSLLFKVAEFYSCIVIN